MADIDLQELARNIRAWGRELGFQQVGFAGIDLPDAEARLDEWLAAGHHGGMHWLAERTPRRSRPAEVVPGTAAVICVRRDYLVPGAEEPAPPDAAMIARYARGREYHRSMRRLLQRLADRITAVAGPHGYRVFVDSGPLMEKPLAERAGLGWIGRHTNLVSTTAGSWFLLGEILTDIPLPADDRATDHCGTCFACAAACPTGAIVAPYVLDARRCISYLTIEHRGPIPPELRAAMGNRVFGCDDCQAVCPWNKFAQPTDAADFRPRHGLDAAGLAALFSWSEPEWRRRTEGSPLRRAGYERWLRNLAVALGNAPPSGAVRAALEARQDDPSALVREHVAWALERQARAPADGVSAAGTGAT